MTSSTPRPPSTPASVSPLEPVPAVWPGAFGLLKYSTAALIYNIKPYLGLIGLSILASIVASMMETGTYPNVSFKSPGHFAIWLIVQLFSVALSASIVLVVIAAVKRREISVDESIKQGILLFVPYFVLTLLRGLIIIGSALLFIIPVFFVAPRLLLAEYFMFDAKKTPVEAIKASWEATRGHIGKVWGIIGASFVFALIALTIIGIPVAIYLSLMYAAAFALLYFYLQKQPSPEAPTAPAAPSKK